MPIYEYECSACAHITISVCTSWRNGKEAVQCENCLRTAHKIMSVPSDITNPDKRRVYHCLSDKPMNYSEKKQYLKEHKLIEAGDSVGGSKQDVMKGLRAKSEARKKKEMAAERRKAIKEQVAKFDTKTGKRKYE